jgi:hypothetical protein
MDLSDIGDLSVPANWYVVDVDPATRRERAVDDVAGRVAAQPDLAPFEKTIVEALIGFGEDSEEARALSCAVLWEPSEYGPVVAYLTVLLVEAERTSASAEIEHLRTMLSARTDTDIGVRSVDSVVLPVGPAVRVRHLRESDEEGAPNVVFDVTQIWIPLLDGEAGPLNLVVSAVTPVLHAGDRVADVARRTAESVTLAGR